MPGLGSPRPEGACYASFPSTQWTTILDPIRNREAGAEAALEILCQSYWRPIYSYIRVRGYDHHDAEELTQEFISAMLRRGSFSKSERSQGKFRTFLAVSLKNFLLNQHRKASSQKRGGGVEQLPLDEMLDRGPADHRTAALEFDKRCASTLLEGVFSELEQEYGSSARAGLFRDIKDCLSGSLPSEVRGAMALKHGMKANAMDVAIHRLRKRFAAILRERVAATMARPEDVNEELSYLMQVCGT